MVFNSSVVNAFSVVILGPVPRMTEVWDFRQFTKATPPTVISSVKTVACLTWRHNTI